MDYKQILDALEKELREASHYRSEYERNVLFNAVRIRTQRLLDSTIHENTLRGDLRIRAEDIKTRATLGAERANQELLERVFNG